jgi:hypothetical protein
VRNWTAAAAITGIDVLRDDDDAAAAVDLLDAADATVTAGNTQLDGHGIPLCTKTASQMLVSNAELLLHGLGLCAKSSLRRITIPVQVSQPLALERRRKSRRIVARPISNWSKHLRCSMHEN